MLHDKTQWTARVRSGEYVLIHEQSPHEVLPLKRPSESGDL
jgi:hypothetical protein